MIEGSFMRERKNANNFVAALLISLMLFFLGCQGKRKNITNVVLITIDTLRADHLGCFGYPRNTSPFLDFLAKEGVLFKNAFASSSHTAPSHASVFTSLHPIQHRLRINGQDLHNSIYTMAEMFQDLNFNTAGFCSVGFLCRLDKGFDLIDHETYKELVHYRQAHQTMDRALDFLETKEPSDKFFMWVHLFDPHRPYHPPEDCQKEMGFKSESESKAFIHFLNELHKIPRDYYKSQPKLITDYNNYDAEILFVDKQIKRLFQYMEKRDFISNTLWIITSDHGEGLGNHYYNSHGKYIYREQVHVPLLFYFGNKLYSQQNVKKLVRHVDILPTLGTLLDVPFEKNTKFIQGNPLFPLDKKDKRNPKTYAFYERRPKDNKARRNWEPGEVYAMQTLKHKYIFHSRGKDEFYNLLYDPFESRNLIDYEFEEKDNLKEILKLKYDLLSQQTFQHSREEIDEKYLKELKALGYIH